MNSLDAVLSDAGFDACSRPGGTSRDGATHSPRQLNSLDAVLSDAGFDACSRPGGTSRDGATHSPRQPFLRRTLAVYTVRDIVSLTAGISTVIPSYQRTTLRSAKNSTLFFICVSSFCFLSLPSEINFFLFPIKCRVVDEK